MPCFSCLVSSTPDAGSVPAARRFVLNTGDLAGEQHDAIAVMAVELAMNAVQYARTEFIVSAEITGRTCASR